MSPSVIFLCLSRARSPKHFVTRATLSVALYARQMQFTWDQIHYLEVRPYQNVKSIRQAVFKISRSQAINCCGGHLGFRRMPQINSVRGLSSIKAISKYEVNLTSGFQDIVFTSNFLHRVQC